MNKLKKVFQTAIVLTGLAAATVCSAAPANEPSVAELRESFRQGFTGASLSGNFILHEMLKYDLTPNLFIQNFRAYGSNSLEPMYTLQMETESDALGQVIIQPKISLAPYSLDNYPNAAYLKSLLEYNKDLTDLRSNMGDVQ